MNQKWYNDQVQLAALDVRFFATTRGKEPVKDWLEALTLEDRKTIAQDIKTVQFGWPLGMPLVRKMAPNMWEIRTRLANKVARTLFTVVSNDIVLLHGFIKKSQETPATELNTALKRLKQLTRQP